MERPGVGTRGTDVLLKREKTGEGQGSASSFLSFREPLFLRYKYDC